MKCIVLNLQVAATLLGVLYSARADLESIPQSTAYLQGQADSQIAGTGFSGSVQEGGKYFQYAHVPTKDHYAFGHKRGNDHHFTERHEKAHPHAGEFKTKVRWGDKHGGYGEHYWDFNHASNGDEHVEETAQNSEYITEPADPQIGSSTDFQRRKRQTLSGISISDDVEFINEGVQEIITSGATAKHGGNYRRVSSSDRAKRQSSANLFSRSNGNKIIDYRRGNSYFKQP